VANADECSGAQDGTRLDEASGMHARIALIVALAIVFGRPSPARADPLFGAGENAREDAFVDGDFDEEDHVVMRLGGHVGASDLHGQSWVSLVAFGKQLRSGRSDVGGFVVVGLALDRIATGPSHRLADPPRPGRQASVTPPPRDPPPPAPAPVPVPVPAPAPMPGPTPPAKLEVSAALARDTVAAALRASGLGVDDARIDDLVSRARASAWLPETRMRAMRLWNDATHTTTVASTDTANFYDAVGANLVLELRLTWRLERLLYAGDEGTLERVRLERLDARTRLATRTLEVLFGWDRATMEVRQAVAGSREEIEARVRAAEAEATLEVLTGGWFGERCASPARPPPGEPP
jgi:hypothetical protein